MILLSASMEIIFDFVYMFIHVCVMYYAACD